MKVLILLLSILCYVSCDSKSEKINGAVGKNDIKNVAAPTLALSTKGPAKVTKLKKIDISKLSLKGEVPFAAGNLNWQKLIKVMIENDRRVKEDELKEFNEFLELVGEQKLEVYAFPSDKRAFEFIAFADKKIEKNLLKLLEMADLEETVSISKDSLTLKVDEDEKEDLSFLPFLKVYKKIEGNKFIISSTKELLNLKGLSQSSVAAGIREVKHQDSVMAVSVDMSQGPVLDKCFSPYIDKMIKLRFDEEFYMPMSTVMRVTGISEHCDRLTAVYTQNQSFHSVILQADMKDAATAKLVNEHLNAGKLLPKSPNIFSILNNLCAYLPIEANLEGKIVRARLFTPIEFKYEDEFEAAFENLMLRGTFYENKLPLRKQKYSILSKLPINLSQDQLLKNIKEIVSNRIYPLEYKKGEVVFAVDYRELKDYCSDRNVRIVNRNRLEYIELQKVDSFKFRFDPKKDNKGEFTVGINLPEYIETFELNKNTSGTVLNGKNVVIYVLQTTDNSIIYEIYGASDIKIAAFDKNGVQIPYNGKSFDGRMISFTDAYDKITIIASGKPIRKEFKVTVDLKDVYKEEHVSDPTIPRTSKKYQTVKKEEFLKHSGLKYGKLHLLNGTVYKAYHYYTDDGKLKNNYATAVWREDKYIELRGPYGRPKDPKGHFIIEYPVESQTLEFDVKDLNKFKKIPLKNKSVAEIRWENDYLSFKRNVQILEVSAFDSKGTEIEIESRMATGYRFHGKATKIAVTFITKTEKLKIPLEDIP